MAAGKAEVTVPALFSRLQRAIRDEDDEQALDLTKRILEISRDDPDAIHCQLVSLVHLGRFESALQLIRSINKKRGGVEEKVYQLEEAYCLYRQEKYTDALSVLSPFPPDHVGGRELRAQVQYKQEQYLKAMQTYQELLSEGVEKDVEERVANYYAAVSQCGRADADKADLDMTRVSYQETMEQRFNMACCRLESGCGREAMELLEKAESLYRESLEEEGLTEEEIAEEMAIIQVQKGYCFHVQEQVKNAMSCYNAILKLRPDDAALIAVASNNILVLNRDKDIFDSKKKLKVLASEGASRKLTCLQKLKILFNRCMFSLHTNQLDQCRELGNKLRASHPNSDLTVLAEVALLNREKKVGVAVECLEGHLLRCAGAGVEVRTVLAQLQLNQGDTAKACSTLLSIPAFSSYVGVASTLASLHAGTGTGGVGVAMDVLEQTLEYWMGKREVATSVLIDLVKQVSRFQLAHSYHEAAAKVLNKVLTLQEDLELRALLISAFSRSSPEEAEAASRSLPAFKTPAHLDVDSMEQTPFFRHSRKPTSAKAEVDKTAEVSKTKKRKRKPRLPKNVDPNVTPDPERWLPLRERSYYRKSRRKGVAITSRGTQGLSAGSANLMSQLDASKPAKSAEEAIPDVKAIPSPKAKPQSKQKKARKKKGGKW